VTRYNCTYFASASDTARPTPPPPPVTKATLFLSRNKLQQQKAHLLGDMRRRSMCTAPAGLCVLQRAVFMCDVVVKCAATVGSSSAASSSSSSCTPAQSEIEDAHGRCSGAYICFKNIFLHVRGRRASSLPVQVFVGLVLSSVPGIYCH
jgi:hypothetical protein